MYERNSNIGDVFHHNYVGLDCWLNSPIYTLNRYLSMGRDRTSLYRYICIHFFIWCKPLVVVLQFLGKHSMNMFLTHTMFRAVYFHDFIYSFYNIWIDYIVLIAVSVATSICIEFVKKLIRYGKITKYIKIKACSMLKLE